MTNPTVGFTVSVDNFSGPIDLLLQLIRQKKLHISDVSLASITDDFLRLISNSDQTTPQTATHILVVAATLVLIKSKSLLPDYQLSAEEKLQITDLQDRLQRYAQVQQVAGHIKDMFGSQYLFLRGYVPHKPIFSPTKQISVNSMHAAIQVVIARLPKAEEPTRARLRPSISLADMVNTLEEYLQQGDPAEAKVFQKLLRIKPKKSFANNDQYFDHKVSVVVGFLAVLEMHKSGTVHASQDQLFHDMILKQPN